MINDSLLLYVEKKKSPTVPLPPGYRKANLTIGVYQNYYGFFNGLFGDLDRLGGYSELYMVYNSYGTVELHVTASSVIDEFYFEGEYLTNQTPQEKLMEIYDLWRLNIGKTYEVYIKDF